MVVDDSHDIAVMFETLLALSPYFTVVSRARDGAEAIDVAEATHPELILLDVLMPRMDGIEALRHLRALVPEAKVVLLSVLSPWIVERRLDEADHRARPDLIITKSELFPKGESE
jgi:DNA-binding NarL/FixJ family response regulator